MESIRKREKKKMGRKKIEKKKQLRTGSPLQGIERALQEQKSKPTKPTPQAMSDLHPLNNNKIIIIIKVYENKRTPGNLGIKSNTPNPKPFSVM